MKTTKRKFQPVSNKKSSGKGTGVSRAVEEEFKRFLEYHSAGRMNRNLRRMLLEFMMTDGACENFYFKDLLYDLEGLFDLLDAIEADKGIKG